LQLAGIFGVCVLVNTRKWVVISILIAVAVVVLFLFHDAILAWVGSAVFMVVVGAAMFWSPLVESDDEDEEDDEDDDDEDE
jgi:hypothetical protein